MNATSELEQRVTAAFEVEPRINLHRWALQVTWRDASLVLDGSVQNLAAKRIAFRVARHLAGRDKIMNVVDLVQVVPASPKPDGDMLESLTRSLLAAPDLANCSLRRRHRSEMEALRNAAPEQACGDVEFAVADGEIVLAGRVISLSLLRIIEALAWWTPGCRNVANRLRVEPPEEDSDGELADAVRLVLEMDPSLPDADSIGIAAFAHVVTLSGAVREAAQKRRAEHDAWCVNGVDEVLNRVQIVA